MSVRFRMKSLEGVVLWLGEVDMWRVWLVVLGLVLGVGCYKEAPSGEYVEYVIDGGSVRVLDLEGCEEGVDAGKLVDAANVAVREMRRVWPEKMEGGSVQGMKVVMKIDPKLDGTRVTGAYHTGEEWVVLRCGFEGVMMHEMFHALAHKKGIWCYSKIHHVCGYNLNCTPFNGEDGLGGAPCR